MRSKINLLLPVSAVVFGLLTWSIAHAATFLMFADKHRLTIADAHDPEPAAVQTGEFGDSPVWMASR